MSTQQFVGRQHVNKVNSYLLALTTAMVAASTATAQTAAPAPVQYQYAPAATARAAAPAGYTYGSYYTAPAATYGTTGTPYYTVPAATTYAQAAPAATTTAGDPYGFVNWLNGVRSQYGLGAVGYDPNLASWAAVNSAQQNSRGLGHFTMGTARRQNSAMGSIANIGAQWLNSPAHRAALLDPTVRWIGLAGSGAYWTLNLR